MSSSTPSQKTTDRQRLGAIRAAINNILVHIFSDEILRKIDGLSKPGKFRRRVAKESEPWLEIANVLTSSLNSDSPTDAATALIVAAQKIRALELEPALEAPSFFVITELVEFLVTCQGHEPSGWRLVAELRRVHEPDIADLLQTNPAEYAAQRESGRVNLRALSEATRNRVRRDAGANAPTAPSPPSKADR